MARKKKPETAAMPSHTIDGVPYEVHDAYHALRRAREVMGNKKLMAQVKKHANSMATENKAMAHHVGMLAKSGRVSEEQVAKLKKMHSVA